MWTSPELLYMYTTVADLSQLNSIVFSAQGESDASVLLRDDSAKGDAYEIVIGGWGNTFSVIRRGLQKSQVAESAHAALLNASEARPFWLRWTDTTIELGRVCRDELVSGGELNGIVGALSDAQSTVRCNEDSFASLVGWKLHRVG
jgi:hypothetical protein